MEYKKKVTTEVIEDILSKGVKTMPQNPASVGYTPAQIRAFYYMPEELILSLLSSIEDDISKALESVNDLFVVTNELPNASKETKGKIYLVPLTDSEENNKYIEYITVKNGEEYSWEKVGIKELNIIYDNELNEQSENAIKNKVVAKAIASLVTEIGKKISKGTLATINGQSIEKGGNIEIQGGSDAGSNTTVDSELDAESENPVQNKVIKEALDGKVDKIEPTVSVNGGSYAYATTITSKQSGSNVSHSLIEYSSSNKSSTIPLRGGSGNFYIGKPSQPEHCSTKGYVDDEVAKVKWYKHTFSLKIYDDTSLNAGYVDNEIVGYAPYSTQATTIDEMFSTLIPFKNLLVNVKYYDVGLDDYITTTAFIDSYGKIMENDAVAMKSFELNDAGKHYIELITDTVEEV